MNKTQFNTLNPRQVPVFKLFSIGLSGIYRFVKRQDQQPKKDRKQLKLSCLSSLLIKCAGLVWGDTCPLVAVYKL